MRCMHPPAFGDHSWPLGEDKHFPSPFPSIWRPDWTVSTMRQSSLDRLQCLRETRGLNPQLQREPQPEAARTLLHMLLPFTASQGFPTPGDMTTVGGLPGLDNCALSSMRRNTGVLTGSSTFEPLTRKASYIFTAAPK